MHRKLNIYPTQTCIRRNILTNHNVANNQIVAAVCGKKNMANTKSYFIHNCQRDHVLCSRFVIYDDCVSYSNWRIGLKNVVYDLHPSGRVAVDTFEETVLLLHAEKINNPTV